MRTYGDILYEDQSKTVINFIAPVIAISFDFILLPLPNLPLEIQTDLSGSPPNEDVFVSKLG